MSSLSTFIPAVLIACALQVWANPAASSAATAPPEQRQGIGNADIPNRPEKLRFPSLVYEPPAPADYRVPLASGPIAYVVPDRELPLVNVVIYVRTGGYLDPAG